jgi:hypothetical protein
MSERPRLVGMAWYDRETYREIRGLMADGERMAETYDAWLASAEQVAGEVARSGIEVVRVPIEPHAFITWCEERGRPRDGAARTAYANEAAAGTSGTA